MKLAVDYTRSIMDLLDAAGIGYRAEARLGVFGTGSHELAGERLSFPRDVDAREVIAAMAEDDLRPATLFELVSAKLAEPALDHIAALGSCDVNFVGGSASPAIHANQLVMTGILHRYPRGWEFLAVPKALDAGLGTTSHNHLLPFEQKRSPKLRWVTEPCEQTFEIDFDGALDLAARAKQAKYEKLTDAARDVPPAAPGTRRLSMTVLHLNRQATSDDVRAELAARGLRPATAHELVGLVQTRPAVDTQRSIWSIASSQPLPVGSAGDKRHTLMFHHGIAPDTRWGFHEAFVGVRAS